MVTLTQLRDARLNPLDSAACDWTALARDLDAAGPRAASGVAGTLLASGWAGADADAAYQTLDRQDSELRLAAQEACGVAPLVETAVAELRAAQSALVALLGEATGLGMTVRDDGRVDPLAAPPGGTAADPTAEAAAAAHKAKADELSAAIADVLTRATEADGLLGDGVRQLAPDAVRAGLDHWGDAVADGHMVATLASIDAAAIPHGDAAAVRAWWDGLTDAQRQRFLVAFPEVLGGLDGLPALVRDRANRIVLGATEDGLRRELDAEKAKLAGVTGGTRGAGVQFITRINELTGRLAAVQGLRADLDFAPGHDERRGGTPVAYLLGFSAQGDGKAIVALGNPDQARHTAVFVPGMGVALDDSGSEVGRMRDLWAAARGNGRDARPRGDVATIAWLGYDAPDSLDRALSPDDAKEAAPVLSRFVGGLRTTHDPASADHVTVIGHSYGSLVVGEAAQGNPALRADDIVAVGSPGMHAHDAAQLGTDPDHVWVAQAAGDRVPTMGGLAYALPGTGVTPTDRAFGANRFTTDGSSGHSSYWDTEHPDSLENQAAIVAGRYNDVSLMWGQAPPPAE